MKSDPLDMRLAGCFSIPDEHPSLPGHFPGRPVVPGVVLIDHAAALIGAQPRQVKFLAPVLPGQKIEVRYQPGGAFICLRGAQPVVSGLLA